MRSGTAATVSTSSVYQPTMDHHVLDQEISRRRDGRVAPTRRQGIALPPSAGSCEIDRPQADGRWDAAYTGPATIAMPEDLATALHGIEAVRRTFET